MPSSGWKERKTRYDNDIEIEAWNLIDGDYIHS